MPESYHRSKNHDNAPSLIQIRKRKGQRKGDGNKDKAYDSTQNVVIAMFMADTAGKLESVWF